MDITSITSLVGVLIAIFAASVSVFNLEEGRRLQLLLFWKRWLKLAFIVVILLNSGVGLSLFFRGPAEVTRTDIFGLLLHLFNLFAIPVLWFLLQMFKLLDAREAKRVELAAEVTSLKTRLSELEEQVSPKV